jgi:uncharacterized membrane protein
MDIDVKDLVQMLTRWAHIVAGVIWIGHLYFFNFVNGPFAGTMDGPTKQKVVPELMPRALFWFRWGAAWTWLTGVVLLGLVFHMARSIMFEPGADNLPVGWGPGAGVMVALTVLGAVIYDPLASSPLGKNNKAFAWVGLVLVAAVVMGYLHWAHFTYRAMNIHLGGMFGTLMAFNVWFRIWPNQQKIIAAVKAGTPPDAALVAQAGQRSRHNTYMSVPLIWTMINMHTVTLPKLGAPGVSTIVIVAIGWWVTMLFYGKAGKVKGF